MTTKRCGYCQGTGRSVPDPSRCLECKNSPTGICTICSRFAENIRACLNCGGTGKVCAICWEKVNECECANHQEFREELLRRKD